MLSDIQQRKLASDSTAWEYKGLVLWIEQDHEDDCTKNWHFFMEYDGTVKGMPLSPYAYQREMHLWVDAGRPRPRFGNWYPAER